VLQLLPILTLIPVSVLNKRTESHTYAIQDVAKEPGALNNEIGRITSVFPNDSMSGEKNRYYQAMQNPAP
jgi:hypothetical protein